MIIYWTLTSKIHHLVNIVILRSANTFVQTRFDQAVFFGTIYAVPSFRANAFIRRSIYSAYSILTWIWRAKINGEFTIITCVSFGAFVAFFARKLRPAFLTISASKFIRTRAIFFMAELVYLALTFQVPPFRQWLTSSKQLKLVPARYVGVLQLNPVHALGHLQK
ncbi:hypothetical protein BpHYR1_030196 [Brachionus plicatilis]|uniref:Uncharacterized protein n=1 Tax=Brachionus plicatilis TaxID=10195 RepID=A0A3M7RMM9_BRAPC|nr:hypothetical protein BpHYR1_030196 [Brachionus plicatilis]